MEVGYNGRSEVAHEKLSYVADLLNSFISWLAVINMVAEPFKISIVNVLKCKLIIFWQGNTEIIVSKTFVKCKTGHQI